MERKELVKDVVRENRISKKTGNPYQMLIITFKNGYKLEVFLNNEQQFVLADVPVVN